MMRYFVLLGTVAFVVLGQFALALLNGMRGEIPAYFANIMLAMTPAHVGLISLWVGLGGKPGPWRLTAATVCIVLWMHWSPSLWEFPEVYFEWWYLILLGMTGLLSGLLMVARFLGVELTNVMDERPSATDADHRWLQFTLRSMLSWTAGVAMMIAALRYVPTESFPGGRCGISDYVTVFVVCMTGIPLSLIAMWIGLGNRQTMNRWATMVIFAVLAVIPLWWVCDNFGGIVGQGTFAEDASFFVAQAVWLIVPLRMLHMVGYRLIWRRRREL